MKILDKFLIRSFIPPFLVAFGVGLFVLVLQFMWLWIDEIMGKGLSIFELIELIFYLSMTMVPLALPIGVLISSVMVLGNLAERFELSSFKSSGVGLLRVCVPLFIIIAGISVLSAFTSDKVIPWANLKFYSRFYDIRRSKPALTVQENVFNDEFAEYTLLIKHKDSESRHLRDIFIYGNKDKNTALFNQTYAKQGEMFTTDDKQFIVMNLNDGTQFQESQNTPSSGDHYPFTRIKFKTWQKLFDLTQFERQKTDEDLFKRNQKTQTVHQILEFNDSLKRQKKAYVVDFGKDVGNAIAIIKKTMPKTEFASSAGAGISKDKVDATVINKFIPKPIPINDGSVNRDDVHKFDSIRLRSTKILTETPFSTKLNDKIAQVKNSKISIQNKATDTTAFINKQLKNNFYTYLDSLPAADKTRLFSNAGAKAHSIQSLSESALRSTNIIESSRNKFLYELYLKYSLAIICMVFLFIGAPMGAIIQKGGFGYPFLISIVFFMIFMVSLIYCKNLKENDTLSAFQAAFIPVFIMLPFAVVLTWRALNDYKMSVSVAYFKKLGEFLKSLRSKSASNFSVSSENKSV